MYKKKPRKLLPWRRHELNFTGRSITDLLAEGQVQQLNFATSSDYLFDAGKGTDNIFVEVGLDGELKSVLSTLDLKLQAKEQKSLSISTDFGKITHLQTDLFEVLHAHRIRVNPDHPIIREAHKNGNTLFVIATIYQAEHCNIEVSFAEKSRDTASAVVEASTTSSVPLLGANAGANLRDSKSTVKVVNRDKPTVIAYLLLRMAINSDNELIPKLNNRLDQASNQTRVDLIDGPHAGGKDRKLTVPKINPADSVVGEWVVVDMVREWKPEDSVEVGKNPAKAAELVTHKEPSIATNPRNPCSVAASLAVPSLNPHYVYSLKEFQCFASNTYAGVVDESQKWVCPVQSNQALKEAFLAYANPPNSHQKLRTLSQHLQDLGSAMRTPGVAEPHVLPALEPIINAFSTEPECRLNENTSLIVIAEACLEFPQHVMKMICELQKDKRDLLLDVVRPQRYPTVYFDGETLKKDPLVKGHLSIQNTWFCSYIRQSIFIQV
ncbi:hypothetical protein GBAR_LOCUS1465 [Geodia barretti]|uniref:Uncharacterized protein n=1 Tax=Geodia barretti TaxID=519541 RepID=A0AA35QW65_GEOBA|nr:hypothetical protein GBAR_LOCUS1465 [Geodia barretti]